MEINTILLAAGLIIMFGFFAEFLFKRFGLPDVLLLTLLGFVLGPSLTGMIDPADIAPFAPLFTTIALIFLLFEGSLNISLGSLARELFKGTILSIFNFIVSVVLITLALKLVFNLDALTSLLVGLALSGTASDFSMQALKKIRIKQDTYTALSFEAAFTDVFTIVLALAVMQIIAFKDVSLQLVIGQVVSLFAVAGFIGFLGGAFWVFVDKSLFKEHRSYMSTVAFILILYFVTEYLGGNGAIAALFFGIVLKNSKQLANKITGIVEHKNADHVPYMTQDERFFHAQIGFFLKTFFYVFIGLLLNLKDDKVVLTGGAICLIIVISRQLTRLVIKEVDKHDRSIITAVYARGLAGAAVIQIAFAQGAITQMWVLDMAYFVIVVTSLMSSLSLFFVKLRSS